MADPTAAWDATSRAPATGNERIPCDTSGSSGPGQLTVDEILARGGITRSFGLAIFTSGTTVFNQGELNESGTNVLRTATTAVLGSTRHICPSGNMATINGVSGYLLGGRAAGSSIAATALIISPDPSNGTSAGAPLILCSAPAGTSSAGTVNAPLEGVRIDENQVLVLRKPVASMTGSRYGEADESVTSSTTLVSLADAQCDLLSGRTYAGSFEATFTAGASGGVRIALTGPTMTAVRWQATIIDTASGAVVADSFNSLAGVLAAVGGTEYLVRIDFVARPSAAGTLAVQFAQQTSNGTATTALALYKAEFKEAF